MHVGGEEDEASSPVLYVEEKKRSRHPWIKGGYRD
jgi:hypothetical protein